MESLYQGSGNCCLLMVAAILFVTAGTLVAPPLGLPPVPIPADNLQTPEKIKLGDRLFHDARSSMTGKISCSTCHEKELAFTDAKIVSEGINGLKGTRNAPTVVNTAYNTFP